MRQIIGISFHGKREFQSTHSLRSATFQSFFNFINTRGFNPRTPCGVRHHWTSLKPPHYCFNPRTPCGVRPPLRHPFAFILLFQSTHSLRSATSIPEALSRQGFGFNPRTPCGVRPRRRSQVSRLYTFQSTHSLRSATGHDALQVFLPAVSIHALLAECDQIAQGSLHHDKGFNPRTPCGVRLCGDKVARTIKQFQSTHSLRSATNRRTFL